MKICLVGSLLPIEVFDEIVRDSKVKPSNAPENFQMMLAKGMAENGQEIDVISFPNTATFPNGKDLYLRKKQYTLSFGTKIKCPALVNLPFIKQISIFIKTYCYLKRWFKKNKNDKKSVISYSDYPPYANACRLACKREKNAECILLMTDLPTFSLMPHKPGINTMLNCGMDKEREKNFDKFCKYILLTEHMAEKMRVQQKPYIVLEGFSDPASYMFEQKKSEKKVLMYSGALSDVHNISSLIDAFLITELDCELWIFGSGNKEAKVKEAAQKDSRITFFGKVSREELLKRQKEATLLISVKSALDEHTKYAFPSKILEYMTSGTAVLSTRVGGIPEEYFNYIIPIEDESIEGISESIKRCFELSSDELNKIGQKSKEFAATEKNCKNQAKKIIDFISKES